MQYRRLGRTGMKVSELALGAGNWGYLAMDEKSVRESMAVAWDAGIIYFDNAQSYTNGLAEEIMGRVLKEFKWPRIKYIVSTKYYWGISDGPNERNTLNRKFIIDGINGSLDRLRLDYVDLVYCHRPDVNTPIEETVWAMHNIIEWGKALYWGTSDWSAEQIRAAWELAERHHLHKPVVEQPEYSLMKRKRVAVEHARLCSDIGIGLAAFSPLAGGLLSGKYSNGIPADSRAADNNLAYYRHSFTDQRRIEIAVGLERIAKDLGCTLAQMSIAWCLTNPNINTAILGASRPAQVIDNVKALDVLPKLTSEVLARIESVVGDYSESWVGK